MNNYKWNQYNNNKKLIQNLIDFNKKKQLTLLKKVYIIKLEIFFAYL